MLMVMSAVLLTSAPAIPGAPMTMPVLRPALPTMHGGGTQHPVGASVSMIAGLLDPAPLGFVAQSTSGAAEQMPVPAPAPAPPTGPQATPPHGGDKDIVITGRKETAGDPLRAVNAQSFAATQKVEDAVIGPVARTYKQTVPSPIRRGIHNFLYNLREPIVFLNFLLQLKPGKAAETVGRFAINSTIGAVGVIDMAKRKPFRLPRRSNGFANTLGYYGVKNGPFLFLPLVGPTTVRDLFGGAIDRLILPVGVGKPFTSTSYTVPAGILGALDHRSEFDQTLKDLHDNSPDPYAATRAFYLNRRQAEIDHLHGRVEGDPAGMSGPPPSTRPFVPKDLEPGAVPPADAPATAVIAPDAPPATEPPVAAPPADAVVRP